MTYCKCTRVKIKMNIRPDHLKFDVSVHTEIFWFQILGIMTNLSAIYGTGISKLIEKLIVFFTEEKFEKQDVFVKFSICSPFNLIAVLKKQLFSFEIFLSNKWVSLTPLFFLPRSCMDISHLQSKSVCSAFWVRSHHVHWPKRTKKSPICITNNPSQANTTVNFLLYFCYPS